MQYPEWRPLLVLAARVYVNAIQIIYRWDHATVGQCSIGRSDLGQGYTYGKSRTFARRTFVLSYT